MSTSRKRKRDPEASAESVRFKPARIRTSGPATTQLQPTQKSIEKLTPILYSTLGHTLQVLKNCFDKDGEVNFAGSFRDFNSPPVDDKARIQVIANEIWKVTGYRFTVKDHPQLKNGHKTRLCCCQDANRKSKARPHDGSGPRTLSPAELAAKQRFPCKSRLLISSCEVVAGFAQRLVTIRMRHLVNHERYEDAGGQRPPPSELLGPIPSSSELEVELGSQQLPTPLEPHPPLFFIHRFTTDTPPPLPPPPESEPPSPASNLFDEEEGVAIALQGAQDDDSDQVMELATQPKDDSTERIARERLKVHIKNMRDFCDGLEYQLQFGDYRMVDALETKGAGFLGLVQGCLEQEGRWSDPASHLHQDST